MRNIEHRLATLEETRPGFTVPSRDTPVQTLGFLEWLYLVVTLPPDDPHRLKLRKARWSDTEFQRDIADRRAMREFRDAVPADSLHLLLAGLRISVAQHAASLK